MHVLTTVDETRIAALRDRDEFFWIDLQSPTDAEIAELGTVLDLHPVALEDTREFGQRPKLDSYEDHVLLVFFTARLTGDPLTPAEPIEVHIYLSGEFMVTVRKAECTRVDDLHGTLAGESTDHEERLVYLLLDALTDAYYPVIDAIEERVDGLEEAVLTHTRREQLVEGYRLKQT